MLNWLKEFFISFWSQAIELLTWVFTSFVTLISDVFYYIYDGILVVVESMISAIDFATLQAAQAFSGWDLLPPQVIYILDVMNIGSCLAALSAAYSIRLLLNLIPASLTRV